MEVRQQLLSTRGILLERISDRQNEGINFAKSADSPRFVTMAEFRDPRLVDRATDQEAGRRIDQYLTTLKLRLRTRLDDRRWQSFFSYEQQGIRSFQAWMERLGIGRKSGPRVSVLDCSMLASEVLPFACALLGRLLLEAREMLRPEERSRYPWVLVLEEAHNYARPPARATEDRGAALSRRAFERVAKEGRKFGLSLIVASQRPSEISPTIISQCANFFSHRLQNPDDIDHFRRIIPRQAQRLLDQSRSSRPERRSSSEARCTSRRACRSSCPSTNHGAPRRRPSSIGRRTTLSACRCGRELGIECRRACGCGCATRRCVGGVVGR